MIELIDVSIKYDKKTVIKKMNIQLEKSTITAVIGESGTGKTSLAMAIMGMSRGHVSGQIIFKGKDILSMNKKENVYFRRNHISMVHQNNEEILNPAVPIIRQVALPMMNQGIKGKLALKRATKLLLEVDIKPSFHHYHPGRLSGGMLQRVQLAIALANNPDILILDEATSALDAITKSGMVKLIKRLGVNRVVLFITHDISVAQKIADHTMVLYGGQILEHGDANEVLNNPKHPYTRGLLRSYPTMTTTKDLQGLKGDQGSNNQGCPFYERCTQSSLKCKDEPLELKEVNGRYLACHRNGIVNAIELKSVSKYFGRSEILSNVSFVLRKGETLAIVGESGSGKSTLAKCVVGLEDHQGSIYYDRELLRPNKRSQNFHQDVQFIFQEPSKSLNMTMSIREILYEPMKIQKIDLPNKWEERAKKLLMDVQLPSDDDFLSMKPSFLSGGELQRLVIARALMLAPKVIIADEATAALDVSIQAKIVKLLMTLQEQYGLTLIFITHDIALGKRMADSMLVLKDGKVEDFDRVSQVIYQPTSDYTRTLIENS